MRNTISRGTEIIHMSAQASPALAGPLHLHVSSQPSPAAGWSLNHTRYFPAISLAQFDVRRGEDGQLTNLFVRLEGWKCQEQNWKNGFIFHFSLRIFLQHLPLIGITQTFSKHIPGTTQRYFRKKKIFHFSIFQNPGDLQ